jgi:hypothetical protein
MAAAGNVAETSSFSRAKQTTGYCSCTHLNWIVAHTPVLARQKSLRLPDKVSSCCHKISIAKEPHVHCPCQCGPHLGIQSLNKKKCWLRKSVSRNM